MQGAPFGLTREEFTYLDTFLSTVKPTVGFIYEWTLHTVSQSYSKHWLAALGFEFLYVNSAENPVFCFRGLAMYSFERFNVPADIDISNQWTIVYKAEFSVNLCWNGPAKDIEINVKSLLTAEEARELTKKAREANKDLEGVLRQILETAHAGNYNLVMVQCPKVIRERLLGLGFNVTADIYRSSYTIRWGGE